MTVIQGVFRANLIVNSKKSALEFYKGVKAVIMIPMDERKTTFLRIEPNCHISVVTKEDVRKGISPFVPASHDPDGSVAFLYRRYINQYLKHE